jgi:hypothetical protein
MRDVLLVPVFLVIGMGIGLVYKRLGVRPGWQATVAVLATVFALVAVRAVVS